MTQPMSITAVQIKALPTPLMMAPEQMQRANEYTYSRRFIDKYIRFELDASTVVQEDLDEIVDDIYQWLSTEFYTSKQTRLDALRAYTPEQMRELMTKLLIGCTLCQEPELFTSITGKLAYRLGWDKHRDAIITVSELLVFLAQNQLIRLVKIQSGGKGAKYNKQSIALQSKVAISEKLINYIRNSSYLPPLVCRPKTLTRNDQSGYLTFNDRVTLNGRIDGNVSLDVINTQNQMALTLDLEFLLNIDEAPNKPLDTAKKVKAWAELNEGTQRFCLMLHEQSQGNREHPGAIYFNHKIDLRGRMYCEGYHVNYQGNPWRKAMVELHEVQYIEVPEQYRT